MVRSRHWRAMLLCAVVALSSMSAIGQTGQIDINVVTKGPVTDAILADLGRYGRVRDVLAQINGVTLRAPASELKVISRLSYVAAANPDAERTGSPIDSVAASSFINGFNTWNLDAINVTDLGAGRVTPFTGAGVYVAVLDTGLLDSWRQYFPQQRIATQFAKAFAGASPESGAEPTNQWEHDQNSHGTHV